MVCDALVPHHSIHLAEVQEMRKIITLLACILILSTLASAHSLEKNIVIRSDDTYNVQFSTEPEYPITDREIHMDFEIWDNTGQILTGMNVEIEMQKEGKTGILKAIETEPGHYSAELTAKEFGVHQITPIINGQKIDVQFEMFIDAFWPKGMVTVGTIGVLLFVLLLLMYKDCKRRK